jgi:hypothetical protein
MADRAAEHVRKEFSLETVVAHHAALYRELIGHPVQSQFKNGSHASMRG